MYENRHARFTAVDPLLASGKSPNPQTFNRYVYVMNNPLAYTDPSGLQAAQLWWEPRNPDGVKPYHWGFLPPEQNYKLVEKDSRGRLSGTGVGLPDSRVLVFNPDGPGYPNAKEFVIDAIGAGGLLGGGLNTWYAAGYREEYSTAYLDNNPEPNPGVRDASLELLSIAAPIGSLLKAGSAKALAALGSRSVVDDLGTTAVDLIPARSLRFTDKITRGGLDDIADDITANGVREPIDYTVIDGSRYILGGNHRTAVSRALGRDVPGQQRTLPFGNWKDEADVLTNYGRYGRQWNQATCRYFCNDLLEK